MSFLTPLVASLVSGLYTSLWGAFKDCPYEGFKPRTFPRSVYFNLAAFLLLYYTPAFRHEFRGLGVAQIFFVVMGIERALAELYKGFFRREDQAKYFVPTRMTFFGRYVASDLLLSVCGTVAVVAVFALTMIDLRAEPFFVFLVTAYATGLVVALGGAYKDAPFEGFKWLKFQRSAVVLALLSPLFYFLNKPNAPVPLSFLIYMNIGLERFAVEYYKTYIQRTMSGKFKPDLPRDQQQIAAREKFHYAALVIIAAVILVYIYEVRAL